MSADPRQVMRILDYRGIDLRLKESQLNAGCRHGQVPPDMISFIGYFRNLIVTELEARKVAA